MVNELLLMMMMMLLRLTNKSWILDCHETPSRRSHHSMGCGNSSSHCIVVVDSIHLHLLVKFTRWKREKIASIYI
jgi:hypothetical protein